MRIRPILRRLPRPLFNYLSRFPLDPLPIRAAARGYNRVKLLTDLRAAVEVALLALPQGMAYALIAGLPIQCGLYACAVAPILGALFGSSRYTVLGPTNACSVLVLSSYLAVSEQVDKVASLGLLLLMTGLFLVAGSMLRLANLTQYISRSVVVGYITGAAGLIIANQIHSCLGYHLPPVATLFDTLYQTVWLLPQTQWPSLGLSLFTLGTWWFLRRRYPKLPHVALALLIATLANLGLNALGWEVAHLSALPFGSWPVALPSVNFIWISQLASAALALALFATIEGTSIAKTLAHRQGDRIDSNQEMFSYGLANLGCAIFGGMPSSGSLTRSALNWSSGAVTQFASLWSGCLCAVALLLCGPLVGYIPMPALAVLVICVGVSLINRHQIRIAVFSTRSDGIVFGLTFIATMLTPLTFAIYLGVGASIVLFLRKASQPMLVEYTFDDDGDLKEKSKEEPPPVPHVSIIHVEGELFFGASDLFREEIRRTCHDPNLKVVVLRLKNAHHLDASSVMAIEELALSLHESGRYLLISGVERAIYRVLRNSGVLNSIGRENLFLASPQAPNISTRRAMRRAQEILGSAEPAVRIFYDPKFQTVPLPRTSD